MRWTGQALALGVLLGASACDVVFGLERDAGPDTGAAEDGATSCAHGRPFGTGTAVPLDGAYSVEGARFTPSQSVAYLALTPAGLPKLETDLYTSPFLDGKFTAISKLPGVSAPAIYDAYPTISPDGHYLVFGSERSGAISLWVATAVNGGFDQPALMRLTFSPAIKYTNEPYLLGDGQTLYFSGMSDTATGWDLRVSRGAPPGFGATPALVGGANSANDEFAPVVRDDELEIWFASNRQDPGGVMALDVYTATRTAADLPFEAPTRVDKLSTAGIDWPLWLSPDACTLYYINKINNVATLYVTRR